jgi:hypothetical protein
MATHPGSTRATGSRASAFGNLVCPSAQNPTLENRRDFRHDPDDPGKKERYQAEALIWKHLPIEGLLGICSHSDAVDQGIKQELAKRKSDCTL